MSPEDRTILQVNTFEQWGGAEAIAVNLMRLYQQRGWRSHLAVRRRTVDGSDVSVIPNHDHRGIYFNAIQAVAKCFAAKSDNQRIDRVADPLRLVEYMKGVETFRFPGTQRLLDLPPYEPKLIQCHNLHGEYFDLRLLPELSQKLPIVLSLQDTWMLSGHCAYAMSCDRWRSGCGACPDLKIYPPIRRDATALNWKRKAQIYAKSQLYLSVPCQWLLKRIMDSMLAPAIVETKVIPNGVDLNVFEPGDPIEARHTLDLPNDAAILLFTASGVWKNKFKDYQTLRDAIEKLSARYHDRQVLLIALGEEGGQQRVGDAVVQFVPFETDVKQVARYYQAADLYLHAARADTFPLVVLEALACGTPVIATAVDGVPEQIHSLNIQGVTDQSVVTHDDLATGVLVGAGDDEAVAQAAIYLLQRPDLLCKMGHAAAQDAKARFDMEQQADAYLSWFEHLIETHQTLLQTPQTVARNL